MKETRRRGRVRLVGAVVMCMLSLSRSWSYDIFEDGVRLFREGKYDEASPLLYKASVSPNADGRVFVLLGLAYRQMGKYADAISAFMRGTQAAGTDRKTLFFNAGYVYYIQGQYGEADSMYSKAIELDSAWAPPFLNRANARVKLERFDAAVADYTAYLTLDPATWQRDEITKLVSLLTAEGQNRRESQARAEAARVASEAEKAAQEERLRKLMDEVSASLQAVDAASTRSAGSEDILEYNEEGQLE